MLILSRISGPFVLAVLAVDDQYLDRVDKALPNANKKIDKATSPDDFEKLQKAISTGDDHGSDALKPEDPSSFQVSV